MSVRLQTRMATRARAGNSCRGNRQSEACRGHRLASPRRAMKIPHRPGFSNQESSLSARTHLLKLLSKRNSKVAERRQGGRRREGTDTNKICPTGAMGRWAGGQQLKTSSCQESPPFKEEKSKCPNEKWVGGRNSPPEGNNWSYLGHVW